MCKVTTPNSTAKRETQKPFYVHNRQKPVAVPFPTKEIYSFLWQPNTMKVNRWLEYKVHNLKFFESCENEDNARQMKCPKMDKDTLIKYMELFGKWLEA